jgi:hypothetical protein
MFLENTSSYYPYISKNGSLSSFRGSTGFSAAAYGDALSGSDYPRTGSINAKYYYASINYSSERRKIYALKNTLDYYKYLSSHYSYSSSYGDKKSQAINLVNIPSIFYGSSINKGSVEMTYYVSGTLIGKIQDINKNGELIQTIGDEGTGSVAGVVLYNEGIILLTGSWDLSTGSFTETLIYNPSPAVDSPRWLNWGAGLGVQSNQTVSSSYTINFEGVNPVITLTMLAHADVGDLNHSNNPTYTQYNSTSSYMTYTSSLNFIENAYLPIKNTVKYPYDNYSGSFEKQTFISKIALYDENKNLIAIAKISKPVRKTENRNYTFKLKLDF